MKMKTYKVYVAEDNGWAKDRPDFESVFFGDHGGRYVHPKAGGMKPVGHVEVPSQRLAMALRDRLSTSKDFGHRSPVYFFLEVR